MATLFKTFVFLDLEGTGLMDTVPNITELCMVAVHRSALEKPLRDEAGTLLPPRIMDKLCLCVDPVKSLTSHAAEITGLSNSTLQQNEKQAFNACMATIVEGFLQRQAQPVCLVAHGGDRYDFPLLKAELLHQAQDLPSSVYCLDAWRAVKGLDIRKRAVPRVIKGYYTLDGIYQRLYRKVPEHSHSAEGDVQTLLMVFLHEAKDLLTWSRHNSRRFDQIVPLYRNVKG
ncbi:three prime repair exonuclease 2-like [Ambystoma mexicanum]|uniref:three prime repair exonuclease 2-like n=1 Tax=Ambystoma mexicanum TaxID=8296 RepID=UPI0037E73F67